MENSQVKIYIDSPKPFYYPGEQIVGSVLLNAIDIVNTNKMIIITKGKQIIKILKTNKNYHLDIEEYEESEEDMESNDITKNLDKSEINKEEQYTEEKEKENKEKNESKTIFKYKKILQISNNNNLAKGKYTFPFEIDIPDNIPGSFLYFDNNVYIEIIYSIKVKLNDINIKEMIPIIIRQKEKLFNYPKENEYSKIIGGCCWERGEAKIKISAIEKYYLGGNNIKLNLLLNNEKTGMKGSPINAEVYQKIILFPKDKAKKIKITKLVGNYKGKKSVHQREIFNEDISLLINENKYITENLSKTKAIKYFKNNNVISLLTQSIKSDLIKCEYEIYAESQFIGWTTHELGVFQKIIIYPPEKGILIKNFEDISKEFYNSLVNKKIFLNNDTSIEESKLQENKINEKTNNSNHDHNHNHKNESDKKRKKKKINFKISKVNDDNKENQNNNINYNINNDDINQNFNINAYKNNINNLNENDDLEIDKDEVFNVSKKNKQINIDKNSKNSKNSNNYKKNFQNYLDDDLDDNLVE